MKKTLKGLVKLRALFIFFKIQVGELIIRRLFARHGPSKVKQIPLLWLPQSIKISINISTLIFTLFYHLISVDLSVLARKFPYLHDSASRMARTFPSITISGASLRKPRRPNHHE